MFFSLHLFAHILVIIDPLYLCGVLFDSNIPVGLCNLLETGDSFIVDSDDPPVMVSPLWLMKPRTCLSSLT